jgi:hypothetical protein
VAPTGVLLKHRHVFFLALAVLAGARVDWADTRGMNEFERIRAKGGLPLPRELSRWSGAGHPYVGGNEVIFVLKQVERRHAGQLSP